MTSFEKFIGRVGAIKKIVIIVAQSFKTFPQPLKLIQLIFQLGTAVISLEKMTKT